MHAPRSTAASAGGERFVTTWLKIAPDNTVTVYVPHADMGQGTITALEEVITDPEADYRVDAARTLGTGDVPSQLESFVPQVITAFIQSRIELVRTRCSLHLVRAPAARGPVEQPIVRVAVAPLVALAAEAPHVGGGLRGGRTCTLHIPIRTCIPTRAWMRMHGHRHAHKRTLRAR